MNTPNPERLFGRVRTFMEARVLLTAAELDLVSELSRAPATALGLAERRRFALRPLRQLLDALAALGLLEKTADVYSPSPDARELLDRESPDSVLPMMLHQAHLWSTWSTLTQLVDPERSAAANPSTTRPFVGAMHVIARGQAPAVVQAVQVGDARRLLDVGGATGTYAEAFLAASADLSATIFDRAEVIEVASERLQGSPYGDRIQLVKGDFLRDPLPAGYDLAFLSAIVHSCSPEENRSLFKNVVQALVPGGRVIIRDFVMSPDRTSPVAGALFAINMLVNTAGGGTYTLDEIRGWLEGVGFERVRQLAATDTMSSLVEAFRM